MKTQVLVIRQSGEAWNHPFIGVFEPSTGTPSVKRVEELRTGPKVVGAKITSVVGNDTIIDYVVSQDDATSVYENTADKIRFEGRFGVVRVFLRDRGSLQILSCSMLVKEIEFSMVLKHLLLERQRLAILIPKVV